MDTRFSSKSRRSVIAAVQIARFTANEVRPVPLYEYVCQGCRHDFELLVRGDETPTCPHCRSEQLEKRFSVPAAHVKGSGGLDMFPGGGCGKPQCGMGGCQGLG